MMVEAVEWTDVYPHMASKDDNLCCVGLLSDTHGVYDEVRA